MGLPEGHVTGGIIPACAGSTPTASATFPVVRDHPRVRGEHGTGRCLSCTQWGSSPRARGALTRQNTRAELHGIIPACAGSTGGCSR